MVVEVAIHSILYLRQIYPVDLFARRKKFDLPVWRSRHPELNEYISGAVKAVGEELILVGSTVPEVKPIHIATALQGNVDKVVVVIKDHNDVALERFIFAIKHMVALESYDRDERYGRWAMQEATLSWSCFRIQGAISGQALSQYFRSFLVKLSMLESQLGPLIHHGLSHMHTRLFGLISPR